MPEHKKRKTKEMTHEDYLMAQLGVMYNFYCSIVPKSKRIDLPHFKRIYQIGAGASLMAQAAVEEFSRSKQKG